MAVFVAASDESAGKDRKSPYVLAGLVASETDWAERFAPEWQKLVLDGPPNIPYMHMVDMKSPLWRQEHGLSEEDADFRINNAVASIATSDFMFSVGLTVSGAAVVDAFEGIIVKSKGRRESKFQPDFLCFLGYAMLTLDHMTKQPQCEKVDFVVENNGKTSDYLNKFHSTLEECLVALDRPDMARLVGKFLIVSKERIPVQASDVLCWHTARARNRSSMHFFDILRYRQISRMKGDLQHIGEGTVKELSALLRGEAAVPVTAPLS